MAAWTTGQQKGLGVVYAVVAVVTWIVALVQAPVAEWGTFTVIIGALLALMGILGVYMALTGRGNTRSTTMSEKTQRTWALVGVIAMVVALVGTFISGFDDWSVSSTFSVGIWVALGSMFISQLVTLSRD